MDTGKRVTATGDSAMTGTTRSAAILFATVAFAVGVFVSSSAMADDSGRGGQKLACRAQGAAATRAQLQWNQLRQEHNQAMQRTSLHLYGGGGSPSLPGRLHDDDELDHEHHQPDDEHHHLHDDEQHRGDDQLLDDQHHHKQHDDHD